MFEETFREIASSIALGIEAATVLIVTVGVVEALLATGRHMITGFDDHSRREIWLKFATWIVLGLEFALAADIIRTAISPSWDDIGKLGAIAAIRTGLNYFLSKDIEEFSEKRMERQRLKEEAAQTEGKTP